MSQLMSMRGIGADFEGCEIRVAAALSGDQDLYEAETSSMCYYCDENPCGCGKMHTGLHWLVAHRAFGKPAVKEDRYNSKRAAFTRFFGGGPATAADQTGAEVSVMEQIFETLNQVAARYTAWDNWLRDKFNEGSLVWRDYSTGENYSVPVEGSRRLVYRAYSGRLIYVTRGAHAAGNGAIQGTARELLVDGILNWKHTRWGNLPLLPIHDQIEVMVPEAEAEVATRELVRCMESDVLSSPGFPVHISVDAEKPWTSWPDSS